MPNWCRNELTVTGAEAEIERFVEGLKRDEEGNLVILESHLPRPGDIDRRPSAGPWPAWFDWERENWGVKWGDCDTRITYSDASTVQMEFSTAWAPPLAGMERLAQKFPSLEFEISYHEPGVNFCGTERFRSAAPAGRPAMNGLVERLPSGPGGGGRTR